MKLRCKETLRAVIKSREKCKKVEARQSNKVEHCVREF